MVNKMHIVIHKSIKISWLVRVLRMTGFALIELGDGNLLLTKKGEIDSGDVA